jgi:uncharacterized integral membrane protein
MLRHSTVEPSDSVASAAIPGSARANGERPAAPLDRSNAGAEFDAPVESRAAPEGSGARIRRKAHRSLLHGYAFVAVALFAFLVALVLSNTAKVKVDWVFGTSYVSLVWLVLFSAILGWLLGILITVAFRWRTRAPRSS